MLDLYYRHQGLQGNPPVVLLHGLFGSLENLGSVAKALAEEFSVYSVDLRNHGRSPHHDMMNYELMAGDIIRLLDTLSLAKVMIVGHSMGGKVAMEVALRAPDRVSGVVVADIAPVRYSPHHQQVFAGLQALTLSSITSRAQADRDLSVYVDESAVRSFLLKNLVKTSASGFQWRMNLSAIAKHYEHIMAGQSSDSSYEKPVLFIKGGASDYIQPRHQEAILSLFPSAGVKVVQNAGHWLHAEKPTIFNRLVSQFLNSILLTA
ncbi:alpha/beta fold hydrolase [Zooshikella sp. RANM57]|uniref:alpha/beta fold hydrolase n=1 Tax=Zooshikella sp. RANM57 TaxID=3425863 RepID=UPI003D6DF003